MQYGGFSTNPNIPKPNPIACVSQTFHLSRWLEGQTTVSAGAAPKSSFLGNTELSNHKFTFASTLCYCYTQHINMQPENDLWKTVSLYNPAVFRFHVNLPRRTVWANLGIEWLVECSHTYTSTEQEYMFRSLIKTWPLAHSTGSPRIHILSALYKQVHRSARNSFWCSINPFVAWKNLCPFPLFLTSSASGNQDPWARWAPHTVTSSKHSRKV